MVYSGMAMEGNDLPFVLPTKISISSEDCANVIIQDRKVFVQ